MNERMKLPLLGAVLLGAAVSVLTNLGAVLIAPYLFDRSGIDIPYVALRTVLLAAIFTFLFWNRHSRR
jgi:hypothetical protein